jgi:hypothetical protein
MLAAILRFVGLMKPEEHKAVEAPMVERRAPQLDIMDPTGEREAVMDIVRILTLDQLFRGRRLHFNMVFHFNKISLRNYLNRKAVLVAIRNCTKEQFMGLHFFQRKALMALIHQETRRFYGTALRQVDTYGGKKGTPLPRLEFPTPTDASEYHDLLEAAMKTMRSHLPAAAQQALQQKA